MKSSASFRFVALLLAAGVLGSFGCGLASDSEQGETSQDVVTTDLTAYTQGQDIIVSFTGMQGTSGDWITIAQPSDPSNVYQAWTFTGGATSGSVTFSAPALAAGTYEARAYYNWYGTSSYTIQQRSASFTVSSGTSSPMLSASSSSYPQGATVPITYSGFSGAATDWIAINPVGSADTAYVSYQYTGGGTSGTVNFSGLPSGTYEARYHANWDATHSYSTLAVSGQFTINGAPTIATDRQVYSTGQSIIATYGNMPGNANDYVAVSAAGAPANSTIQSFMTNGQVSGSQSFSPLPAGNYEARAYLGGTTTILASSTFTVTGVVLTTDKALYSGGEAVTVTFSGMPGNATDWISVADLGSSDSTFVQYFYTNGATSGMHQFNGLAAGTYEIRAYYNNGFTVQARSAPFSVGTVCNVSSAPTVGSVQSGDVTIGATANDATATVTADLATSILFVTMRDAEPSPVYGNAACELTATGVHCVKNTAGTDSGTGVVNIHYTIVTFTSGVSVQRGLTDTTGAATTNVTLTAADPTTSFVVLGGGWNGGTGWGNNEFVRATLQNSTTLELAHAVGGSHVAWQVVTMTGASVTRGTASLASGATSASVSIPAAPSGSVLLASYTTDNPSGIAAASMMLQSRMTSPTSLDFTRGQGGSNISVAWEVVSLPFATRTGVSSVAAGSGGTTTFVPNIDAAQSVALSSSQGIFGTSGGSSMYNASPLDLVGESAFTMVPGANSLTLQRSSSQAAASVAWTVIDFSKTCAD